MKSPFRYQASEVDCYPTTIINALTYLFDGEKITGQVIKMIYCFSLDDVTEKGKIQGTKSDTSLQLLPKFAPELRTKILRGEEVNSDLIGRYLKQDGVAVCDIYDIDAKEGHIVLVLRSDSEWIYMWDPYPYSKKGKILKLRPKVVLIDHDKRQQDENIKVSRKLFDSSEEKPFALGEKKERWCCILSRRKG